MNGMQMNSGPQPNYYNNSNLQNNPFNRPQQLYQPQPIYPPPPAPLIQPNPMNMQPNPMNVQPNTYNMQQKAVNNRTAQSTTIQHIVNNSGYSPCPYCHRTVPTTPRRVIGQAQIFWCFILFLFLPIVCCIPFCMQSCEDVHYECSSCLSDNSAHSLIFYRALFTSLSLYIFRDFDLDLRYISKSTEISYTCLIRYLCQNALNDRQFNNLPFVSGRSQKTITVFIQQKYQ